MTPTEYFAHIKSIYERRGDPAVAEQQMRYMRHQFEFYGLKAAEWLPLSKIIFKESGVLEGEDLKTFVRLCYDDDHREVQFFGIEMAQKTLNTQPPEFIDFIEELITQKSWWDTVDWLSKLAGIHFLRYPELTRPVTERWMASGNIWLQRSAIIFQRLYRKKTDVQLLFDYILRVKGSKEFFLQKGAAWALREYSKTDAQAVVDFISQHDLPPLTKREGLKWLRKKADRS